ncbi:MAG: hypothetical protein Q7K03_03515 [Dehalococcoidia bacterium]|nr:hypothetical protein [Dehalococcoidia bacterium]
MASDLGRWWRTLSSVKLFSKGKPNSPKPMPNSQAARELGIGYATFKRLLDARSKEHG